LEGPDIRFSRRTLREDISMTIATKKTFWLGALAAVLSLILAVPALRAENPVSCSNATMHGTYALSGSGFAGGAPIAVAGEVIYDGQGKGTLVTETASLNGTIFRGITGSGVFTVNSDCTGSKTFTTTAGPIDFDFVITADGSKITWIETDSGVVLTGTGVRLDRRHN
jgi:hypothetical protein